MPEPGQLIDDVIALFGSAAPDPLERLPLVRTGEREPIDSGVRRGVWLRDGGRCQWCGYAYGLQLDHIVPWSNGGSDRSDNLRLLCDRCNETRSNRRTDSWTRVLPVAFECRRCVRPQRRLDDNDEPVNAYCIACRTAGIAERWTTV